MAKDSEKHSALFTGAQPPYVQAIARALVNDRYDHFRTHVLVPNVTDKVEENWWMHRYYQASKIPGTALWTVMKYEYVFGKLTLSTPVNATCFFDALHFCARAEITDQTSLVVSLKNYPGIADIVHYSAAADAADVPLDETGLPYPAANGIAFGVTDTVLFDEKAQAAIQRTKSKPLGPAVTATGEQTLSALLTTTPAEDKLSLVERNLQEREQEKNKEKLKKAFEEAQTLVEAVQTTAKALCDDPASKKRVGKMGIERKTYQLIGGLTGLSAAIATGMTIGIGTGLLIFLFVPDLLDKMGGKLYDAQTSRTTNLFGQNHDRLQKLTKHLPDTPEKTMLEDFTKAARGTVLVSQITTLQSRCADKNLSPRKLKAAQDAGLKILETAEKDLNWSTDDGATLRRQFIDGKFPDMRPQLIEQIDEKADTLSKKLRGYILK